MLNRIAILKVILYACKTVETQISRSLSYVFQTETHLGHFNLAGLSVFNPDEDPSKLL